MFLILILLPRKRRKSGVKKWLSHSDTFAKGAVVINDGARDALLG